MPLPPASQWRTLTRPRTNSAASVLRRPTQPLPDAMVYVPAPPCATDISGPGTWAFLPARLPSGETVVVNAGFVQNTMQDRSQQDRAVASSSPARR